MNIQLHYTEHGDRTAPLLLFLHGGGVSGWMWGKQVQYFNHFHCIVPDLPEQGSSQNAGHFSIQHSAKMVSDLIEEKAVDKQVIVVGFSLGSQILIELMSTSPDLIDIAVINSALVRPSASIKKWIRPSIKLTAPLMRQRWFAHLQAKTLYVGEDYLDRYFEESCSMRPDTLIRILEENMSFGIPADFKKSTAKTLVTVGAREKAMMRYSAADIVAINANCKGVVIPNMGHGLPMANAGLFNGIVESWINDAALPDGEPIQTKLFQSL